MSEWQKISLNIHHQPFIIAIATARDDKHAASCLANMTDRSSPPTNNGSINYSTHLRQKHIIQGELLMSSEQGGLTPEHCGSERRYNTRTALKY